MKFDLHVHTNNSDGIYSYKEVIDLSIRRGLNGIAITDHDNIDGLDGAINYSQTFKSFEIIPGIELSSVFQGKEVHILGYYINYKDKSIIDITKEIKDSRVLRGYKIIEKLNNLGLNITIEEVKLLAREGFIGRPHIARSLINKGYVNNITEAFDMYLKIGAPAYVSRYKISIHEIIQLINKIGGISVLAHPGLINNKDIVDYCISKGINGIECIYPMHDINQVNYFLNIAKNNKLIATGGSDFHGDRSKEIILGKYYVGQKIINQMKERAYDFI